MCKHNWKCSTPRLIEAVGFQRCNNADTDWYVRMPTDSPLVAPKSEMPFELCKDEEDILEPTIFSIDSLLPHWERCVCMLE